MIAAGRAVVGHAVVSLCLFGPVVVLGGEAAILLGVPTALGALAAVGMFLLWIAARASRLQVWAEEPRRLSRPGR